MANLDDLLLEAAGRTNNGPSGRKQYNSRPHTSRRRREGSYSDGGSDSRDDDSDDPGYMKRKPSGSQVPLKKRIDPTEKDDRSDDDSRGGGSGDDSDSSIPSIGSDLYKDDEDREALMRMTELDREMILAERGAKRDDYRLKKKARASSKLEKKPARSRKETPPPLSTRGRSSLKSDRSAAKNDALNEIRVKRMRHQDPERFRRWGQRDTDGHAGGIAKRSFSPLRKPNHGSASSGTDSESEAQGSAKEESDEEDRLLGNSGQLKFEEVKEITIRRSRLAKWFMEPFFEELITGCFVRVGIGVSKEGQSIYRLCLVRNVDASEPEKQYKLENRLTYKYLNLVWGNEASAARWQMARVSDSPPLEEEFNAWLREVNRSSSRLPTRIDILEKREAIQKAATFVYSAETVKQMLQEKKSASSRPKNVAAEKDRLRKEIVAAESRGDGAEVKRCRARLRELETSRPMEKDAKAVRLAEMNRKNREENFRNASELKPVNTSLKAGEAGYDPFSRRWTRSMNYYVSKPGAVNEEAVKAIDASVGPVEKAMKAGEVATAAALEAAAGAGKLVDTNAPVDRGTESNSLHDFELPISLAGLQRFGGAQGVLQGYLARKQKIEATIGYRVPENDGRRHVLTLTVSDYKRRMGLL
ncbi:hypothetical protein QJS10_CPA10g00636 [Acorus calamus]|uniref:Plus3 domain-containing protein n=1 Tax=Acorus calamus TaxID=4465 RepID=A0AAV9DZH2_ACOCL|nr:hypothetical protein QJS10_CPA10g00636 [Acorus calamus]